MELQRICVCTPTNIFKYENWYESRKEEVTVLRMNLEKELKNNPRILVTIDSVSYERELLNILREANIIFSGICYISFNKKNVSKYLKSKGLSVNKFHFIESKVTSGLTSAWNLRESVFSVLSNNKIGLVVIDSISDITSMESGDPFIRSLLLKLGDSSCILTSYQPRAKSKFVRDIAKLADKVIELKPKPSVIALIDEFHERATALFGPEVSDLLAQRYSLKEDDPKILFDIWEKSLTPLLGPENAKEQLDGLKKKYLEGVS